MDRERAAQLVDAGVWLQLSGDLEGARKLFERALKLDPENGKAREFLGLAPLPGASTPPASPSDGLQVSPSSVFRQYHVTPVPPPLGEFPPGATDRFAAPAPPSEAPAPRPGPTVVHIGGEPSATPAGPSPIPSPPGYVEPGFRSGVAGATSQTVVISDEHAPEEKVLRPTPPMFEEPASGGRALGEVGNADSWSHAVTVSDAHPIVVKGTGHGMFSAAAPTPAPEVAEVAPADRPAPRAPAAPGMASLAAPLPQPTLGSKAAPAAASALSDWGADAFPAEPPARPAEPVAAPPAAKPEQPAWAWSASPPPSARPQSSAPYESPAPSQPNAPRFAVDALPPIPRPSPGFDLNAESAWDRRSSPSIRLEPTQAPVDFDMLSVPRISSLSSGTRRRADEVRTLLKGARDLLDLDDHTGAMDLVVKAQVLDPENPEVREMRARSEKTLTAMYESKLGRLAAIPRVLLKDDEIIWLNLDHRAGFVLAQIDGTVSFEDLFAVSGMAHLDTARILAQLVDEGVISRG